MKTDRTVVLLTLWIYGPLKKPWPPLRHMPIFFYYLPLASISSLHRLVNNSLHLPAFRLSYTFPANFQEFPIVTIVSSILLTCPTMTVNPSQ
jgi:hypothetical protein